MVMWRVGEDDTKGRARPLPTLRFVFVFVNCQGWYDLDPHLC